VASPHFPPPPASAPHWDRDATSCLSIVWNLRMAGPEKNEH